MIQPPAAPAWATMPIEPIADFNYAIDHERRTVRLCMRRRLELAPTVVELPLAWLQQIMGQHLLAESQLAQQGRLRVDVLPLVL